jgi:hypothetical protein
MLAHALAGISYPHRGGAGYLASPGSWSSAMSLQLLARRWLLRDGRRAPTLAAHGISGATRFRLDGMMLIMACATHWVPGASSVRQEGAEGSPEARQGFPCLESRTRASGWKRRSTSRLRRGDDAKEESYREAS